MSKRAVCVGINDYPGSSNDLGGCVNDANDWAGVLCKQHGFKGGDVTMLLDGAEKPTERRNGQWEAPSRPSPGLQTEQA